jgi:hypothetical protein
MGNLYQSFVVDVIEVLELPCYVEGDMYRPGSDGKGWGDVAF